MAVTDAYALPDEYRDSIDKGDPGDDPDIERDLKAVSRYLEHELGRFFTKDATNVVRDFYSPFDGPIYPEAENPWKYAGKYSKTLHLDADLVSVQSLVTDDNGDGTPETTWDAVDYQLLPLNADKGPEPAPYLAIYVPIWSKRIGWPPTRLVRITGVWGWPAVPDPIKRATIQLTGILRLETPRGRSDVAPTGEVIGATREGRGIVSDLKQHYRRGTV